MESHLITLPKVIKPLSCEISPQRFVVNERGNLEQVGWQLPQDTEFVVNERGNLETKNKQLDSMNNNSPEKSDGRRSERVNISDLSESDCVSSIDFT